MTSLEASSNRTTTSDRLAIFLLVAASGLHLALTPEHFEESLIYGIAFTAIALFQLGLAFALWRHPDDSIRTIGRWGSLAIVAVYIGARVVVPPGGTTVEELDWRGLLSVVLELGTVATLAIGPPIRARRISRLPGVVTGLTFVLLEMIAGGEVTYSPDSFADATAFFYGGGPSGQLLVSFFSPAIGIAIPPHWFLYLPLPATLLIILDGVLLGYAVQLTIAVSLCWGHSRSRFGLLGILPSILATPVCCGPSLLSVAGVGLAAALATLAVPLLAVSGLLLAANIAWQRRTLRRCTGEKKGGLDALASRGAASTPPR